MDGIVTRLLAGAVAGLLAGSTGAAAEPDATGLWLRPNGSARIEIAPCGAALCGTLVWLKKQHLDIHNPDPAKRAEPLLGRRIVTGLKPTGTAGAWKGSVYNAEDGRTYTGYATLVGTDGLDLEGCVFGGLICKGETWTRVK